MMNPNDAQQIIQSIKINVNTEKINVTDSLGRVLSNNIYSSIESPPFDKSAMDGFAYNGESGNNNLKIIGTVAAGDKFNKVIKLGECAKIMTGAMIPKGADRVVKVENCTEKDGLVSFKPEQNKNIIYRAENLNIGEKVIDKCVIRPQEIGVLSSLGIAKIEVAKQPIVGIITTGTELANPGEKLKAGQIYNSNGFQISAQTKAVNCLVKYYGTVPDDKDATRKIIKNSIEECDVVILSGGVSMGEFDYVPKMIEENGVKILFHKLAIKPGKPTLFGQKDNKFVFGLPGNPVSTFIIFEIFVKPFLYQLMGVKFAPKIVKAKLAEDIKRRKSTRYSYLPAYVKKGIVQPLNYHGSSHLNALINANSLIKIDQGVNEIKKGTIIDARFI